MDELEMLPSWAGRVPRDGSLSPPPESSAFEHAPTVAADIADGIAFPPEAPEVTGDAGDSPAQKTSPRPHRSRPTVWAVLLFAALALAAGIAAGYLFSLAVTL